MNNLATITTLDSREVAVMVEKSHTNLLRDIRGYAVHMENLGELKIDFTDFFIESSYITPQNKNLPCYLITRKGCEFIANKLTGKKGTLFTAAYINRFHEMEQNQTPTITAEQAIQMIQAISKCTRYTLPIAAAIAKPFIGEQQHSNLLPGRKANKTIIEFLNHIRNDVKGQFTDEVHETYSHFCQSRDYDTLNKIEFSRQVCNYLGIITGSKRVGETVRKAFL